MRLVPLHLPPGGPALAAARLVPRLPPGRFTVLTGSFGGLVARFLPPHRMAGLTCVGTLPSPQFLSPAMARRARVFMALPDPLLEALYARHGRRSLLEDGVAPAVVDQILSRPVPAPVLRGRLRAILAGHHGTPPAVPTLWLSGADDPQITWTRGELEHAVVGVHTRVVPGRHFPHASHPEALWATVSAFFRGQATTLDRWSDRPDVQP